MAVQKKDFETQRIHDFSAKLKQESEIENFKNYIRLQREINKNPSAFFKDISDTTKNYVGPIVDYSLASINLDLTTACTHACTFCVDDSVTNLGKSFKREEIIQTLKILSEHGLKSVILIGGGEPTLHPFFVETVKYIKSLNLQLGIVSNGSRGEKIAQIAQSLKPKDYIRFSIDAGIDSTYQKIHRPKGSGNSLQDVLNWAQVIKKTNPQISLGYSFVVCWEGIRYNNNLVPNNIKEIPIAAKNCIDNKFDYLSLKPCLVKFNNYGVETLFYKEEKDKIAKVSSEIKREIAAAKDIAENKLKIVESVNMSAMLNGTLDNLRRQPLLCHAGFFRQVVTPHGIFHCPGFRGSKDAFLSNSDGYSTEKSMKDTKNKATQILMEFNASMRCKDIACFYNGVNWSIQNLIDSNEDLDSLEITEDSDFFL